MTRNGRAALSRWASHRAPCTAAMASRRGCVRGVQAQGGVMKARVTADGRVALSRPALQNDAATAALALRPGGARAVPAQEMAS